MGNLINDKYERKATFKYFLLNLIDLGIILCISYLLIGFLTQFIGWNWILKVFIIVFTILICIYFFINDYIQNGFYYWFVVKKGKHKE